MLTVHYQKCDFVTNYNKINATTCVFWQQIAKFIEPL